MPSFGLRFGRESVGPPFCHHRRAVVAGGTVPLGTVGLATIIILALAVISHFAIERPLLALRTRVERGSDTMARATRPPEEPFSSFHPAE